MRIIQIELEEDSEAERYFAACARIRNISPRALFRRLIDTIAKDQMVASVLDDEDEMAKRRKGEHRHRTNQTAPAV